MCMPGTYTCLEILVVDLHVNPDDRDSFGHHFCLDRFGTCFCLSVLTVICPAQCCLGNPSHLAGEFLTAAVLTVRERETVC